MRILRISLTDGEVGPYGEHTDRTDCEPRQFWYQWDSHLTRRHWHRTELDREGNPYTVKWHSDAFHNGRGAWVERTMALEADGEHPAFIRPAAPQAALERPDIPPTQRGRLNIGERLRSPIGTWTVTESWISDKPGAQGEDRDYQSPFVSGDSHVYYLLTREGGHQEEWGAPDMADADFHRILADQQKLT
jgi:hypothetical protein